VARPQTLVTFGAVLALAAAAAGFAGFAMGAARTPDALAPASAPATFPVVLEAFADARQVTIVPTLAPVASITARRGGIVTRSTCAAGRPIASGTAPWSIDGTPVLALATAEPLYRDLKADLKGNDVTALQRELSRLGYAVHADGVYGTATERAVSELRRARGLGKGTDLALGDVTWLSAPQLTMASCAAVGSEITPGGTLGQTRPALLAAQVQPLPQHLVPGTRTLTVGELTIAVDATGAIGQADLPAFGALPLTATAVEALGQGVQVPLSGTLALADPLTTATVPASAIIASGAQTCVSSGGSTLRVEVVASQLGQSIVSFGSAAPPAAVDTQPDAALTCS
jgi:peptidoglycan hydrolase-like protein with peptidoglycan-binding domain